MQTFSTALIAWPGLRAGYRRRASGSFISEAPLVFFVVFLVLSLPLISLAGIGIRSSLFHNAVRQAAAAAAKARSFDANLTPTRLSAKNTAYNRVTSAVAGLGGVTLVGLVTNIAMTDLGTRVTTRQSTKLTSPADEAQFLYHIEVQATANIEPLGSNLTSIFGGVPGLTAPIQLRAVAREFCEVAEGLDK